MAGVGARDPSPDSTQQLDQAAIEQAVMGDDDDLPIHDYDRLRATEVLPLLADLDADDLARVRAHEVAGRNRFMVLSRIDRELEARGPTDEDEDDEPDAASAEWDTDDEWGGSAEDDADADGADEPDEEQVQEVERPQRGPGRQKSAAGGSILANYEQLKVLEILPRLGDLDADELAQVRRREQAGQRRAMIINRVDRLIVETRPTPPASRAPAKKTTAKKAPAAKAATRKAPAKESVATRAAAKKAPAKKAPAKKAGAKKAPAKKAPARKAAGRASTPTEKRAGAVKKTARTSKKR